MADNTPKDILTIAQKRRHVALLEKLKKGKSLDARELSELRFFEQGKREKLTVLQRREIDIHSQTAFTFPPVAVAQRLFHHAVGKTVKEPAYMVHYPGARVSAPRIPLQVFDSLNFHKPILS